MLLLLSYPVAPKLKLFTLLLKKKKKKSFSVASLWISVIKRMRPNFSLNPWIFSFSEPFLPKPLASLILPLVAALPVLGLLQPPMTLLLQQVRLPSARLLYSLTSAHSSLSVWFISSHLRFLSKYKPSFLVYCVCLHACMCTCVHHGVYVQVKRQLYGISSLVLSLCGFQRTNSAHWPFAASSLPAKPSCQP